MKADETIITVLHIGHFSKSPYMSDRTKRVLLVASEAAERHLKTHLAQRYGVVTAAQPIDRSTLIRVDCVVTTELIEIDIQTPIVYCADTDPTDIDRKYRIDGFTRLDNPAAIVDQVAIAIRNNRPERSRIGALHETATELVAAQSREELFERTARVAKQVLAFEQCFLAIVEDDQFIPKITTHRDEEPQPLDYGTMGKTFQTGESRLVRDVTADDEASPTHGTYRSGISVPIGEFGVFQVISTEPDAFTEWDLELTELLVGYVTATLSRIESEDALRESRFRIERLQSGAADLATIVDEATAFEKMAEIAEEILSLDRCAVMRVEGEYLVPAAYSSNAEPDDARRMHVSEGLAGWTYRTGQSKIVENVSESKESEPAKDEYRSGLSVPIGEFGVFQAVSTSTADFDQRDLELTELLAMHVRETIERIVTERKRNAERDRLAALFENIPDAAIAFEFVDGEPIVRRTNAAFEETFGYPESTVRGESIDDYVLPADGQADHDEADRFNQKLQSGESVKAAVTRQTADGLGYFLLHVIPLQLGEANVSGYAIYTDITEQKQREEELRTQNERLDEFAGIVSHDLRNPINVASGYIDLALTTGETDHLTRAAEAIDRMDSLVSDLLLLARKGSAINETIPVDLETITRRAWANVETTEATLSVADSIEFEADPGRITELFENLVRNSVEHGSTGSRAPPGDAIEHAGATVTVTVGSLSDKDGFFLEDDGPGIAPELRSKVFETGYTTDSDGTGLGLAIIKRIADAHGWDVTITESDNGGARFVFRFDDR